MMKGIYVGILVFIIVVHGLIHLMGFTQAFGLSDLEEFTGETSIHLSSDVKKILGIGWLICTALFLIVSITVLSGNNWQRIAMISIILSQFLIFIWWQDAKAGTIANMLILALLFANRLSILE